MPLLPLKPQAGRAGHYRDPVKLASGRAGGARDLRGLGIVCSRSLPEGDRALDRARGEHQYLPEVPTQSAAKNHLCNASSMTQYALRKRKKRRNLHHDVHLSLAAVWYSLGNFLRLVLHDWLNWIPALVVVLPTRVEVLVGLARHGLARLARLGEWLSFSDGGL